jgi:hypothetical protein
MRKVMWIIVGVFLSGVVAAFIKLTIPLHYKETPLRLNAVRHVESLQHSRLFDPEEVAVEYHYFETDYQTGKRPDWVEVTSDVMDTDTVRVRIYDPRCQDDSISMEIIRYYLRKDPRGHWLPFKEEFSHSGRGRFGWTTEPTN